MKAFQVIISLLILAALLVIGCVSWLSYQDKQKTEEPIPIDKLGAYLKQRDVNPINILGWSRAESGVYVVTELTTPDPDITYTQLEYFWKMETTTGKEWFHDYEGSLRKVDTAGVKK